MNDKYLDLAERKALNWYRVHGPAEISAAGSPQRRLRIALIRRGLVCIYPNRRLGGPIRYSITPKGQETLRA